MRVPIASDMPFNLSQPAHNMKNHLTLILSIILLGSCQFASFTERPGVNVTEFPEAMYGSYQIVDKTNDVNDTHVLVINKNGASINDPIVSKIIDLKDSNNTLSHLGDFYYMNARQIDSLGKYTYYIYPFEFDSKHLYIYKILLTKKSIKQMAKSGLKPSLRRNGEYVMDNVTFKRYVERYMKKKDAIKFKKIK